nr:hypothetical protein CFP56_76790 [Quercus suber]
MASHHPIRKKLQDDPHMLGTKNKEHEDKHNVLMTQKNKVGGSKSELARISRRGRLLVEGMKSVDFITWIDVVLLV